MGAHAVAVDRLARGDPMPSSHECASARAKSLLLFAGAALFSASLCSCSSARPGSYALTTVVNEGGSILAVVGDTVFYVHSQLDISSVPAQGGQPTRLYRKTDKFELPLELVVDADFIHWSDVGLNRLMRMRRADGHLEVTTLSPHAAGLAISAGRLYWASATGEMGRVREDGTDPETLKGLGKLAALTADGDVALATDLTGPAGPHQRLILASFDRRTISVIADDLENPGRAALTGPFVYFGVGTDEGGELRRVARDGTGMTTLARVPMGVVAITDGHRDDLYFATFGRSVERSGEAALYRHDLRSHRTEVVAEHLSYPQQLVATADGVYWIERDRIGRAIRTR